MKLVEAIATAIEARQNCIKSGNTEWQDRWLARLNNIAKNRLPSGSGFDNGTTIDMQTSTPVKIVFDTSFHHMDGYGSYDGWTEHEVIVTPTFGDFDVKISGRDRNDIKDFIADEFINCLDLNFDWPEEE